jgi:predicted DNA-binding transcriptional regulator AlpA
MSFRGGMPKPLPRVPYVESPFVLRAELLTVVPHSMATIDRLEAKGQFPKRILLEPTNRVGWLRSEVTAHLRRLAKRRRSAAQEDHVEAANQELVARSKRSGPTPEDQPANPDHQFAPASATSGRNPDVGRR